MADWEDEVEVISPAPGGGLLPAAPGQTISTTEDVLRSTATGLGKGISGGIGQLKDTKSLLGEFGTWLGDAAGFRSLTPEEQAGFDNPGKALGLPNIEPPSTAAVEQARIPILNKSLADVAHTAQTPEGRFAESAASFGTQAAAGGLPGMVRRIAGGVGAGLTSEGLGQAAEGTWLETPARILGGLVGDLSVNAGANAYKRTRPGAPPVPPREVLKEAGGFGFEQARNLGVLYDGGGISGVMSGLKQRLRAKGKKGRLYPSTNKYLKELIDADPGDPIDIDDLHAIRMGLNDVADAARKSPTSKAAQELFAAQAMIDEIDNFIRNPDPASVLQGDAAQAGKIWGEAMENYAGAMESKRLQNFDESVDLQTSGTHSGLNLDNKYRQRAAWILDPTHPERQAGYSPEVLQALRDVNQGNTGRNTLRWVGKALGGGGGLGAYMTGSSLFDAGALAVGTAMGTGRAVTDLSNYLARKGYRKADEIARSQTPFAEKYAALPRQPPPLTQMEIAELLASTGQPITHPSDTAPNVQAVMDALLESARAATGNTGVPTGN